VAWAIAVDIGGTFTDLVAYDEADGRTVYGKSPTTPGDLSLGILNALEKAGVRLRDAATIKHGTTIVINTVLEGTGARVGLLTTRGFRDVLEIGRGNRPEPFNLAFRRRPPLVPRRLRLEATERVVPGGAVLQPLDMGDLERAAEVFAREGVEAVAIAFLHAYANPAHEQQAAAFLAARGFSFVSLSSDLSREWREYERTSTAVLNAYVMPRVGRYLGRLEAALAEHGFGGRLFMMESNGGVMSVATARRRPIYLVESGPVAGVTGATVVAAAAGLQNVVAFDMGGTTAKASVVEDLSPRIEPLYYVGGYERGYPVQAPVVDIVEVGAGGGSIAWLDGVGNLNVGPRSAGAEPGPVCYGAGGVEPTVTDANLVLGRLSPRRFLGGEMALDEAAARRAIAERVAGPLGHDVLHIAAGIVRIANVVMAGAVRRVTIERGRDPRDFALVAFGGAGPLHAVAIAREVGIPLVVVPPSPGHFSALGMLLADLRHDYAQSYVAPLDGADLGAISRAFADMEASGRALARAEIPGLGEVATTRWADMRYVGQEHTVKVAWPGDLANPGVCEAIAARFRQTYATRYGYADPHGAIEIVALRVSVEGRSPKPTLDRPYGAPAPAAEPAERQVYFEEAGGLVRCPVYWRERLPEGWSARGPVLIEEYASTTLVHPACAVRVGRGGRLEITVGGGDGGP
jgi:N-methylhydantoinase A